MGGGRGAYTGSPPLCRVRTLSQWFGKLHRNSVFYCNFVLQGTPRRNCTVPSPPCAEGAHTRIPASRASIHIPPSFPAPALVTPAASLHCHPLGPLRNRLAVHEAVPYANLY